mmetsp:Transcript_53892/g.161249  ORF Transcript_53892/g.161249 Transcript_53892/m.161249 type:complete len:307 (+) Transcript_53892:289-1209(+)
MPPIIASQLGVEGSAKDIFLPHGTNDLACVRPVCCTGELNLGLFRPSFPLSASGFLFLFLKRRLCLPFGCHSSCVSGHSLFLHFHVLNLLRALPNQRVDDAHHHHVLPRLDLLLQLPQHNGSLPARRRDNLPQNLYIFPRREDGRGADEHPRESVVLPPEPRRRRRRHLEGADLTAKVIPAHEDVDSADEGLAVLNDGRRPHAPFGEEDHSRARAPHRPIAGSDEVLEGVPDAVLEADESHGRGFTTGEDHAVDAVEFGGRTNLARDYRPAAREAEGFQKGLMLLEGSLEGEHPDSDGILTFAHFI